MSMQSAAGPRGSRHANTACGCHSAYQQKGQTDVLVNKKGLIQLPTKRHLMSFKM